MDEQQEQPRAERIADAAREQQDRREEERHAVFHETEVRHLSEPYAATIRDLSRWGVMVECATDFAVRSYVYVVLPGVGALPARVTWSREGRFGANLLEPITDHHFERLIRILPKDATAEQAA